MSITVTELIWQLDIPMTEKIVLLRLGSYANAEGRDAWPAVPRLARECGCGVRNVQLAIGKHLNSGLIEIQVPHDSRTKRPATYRFNMEMLASLTGAQHAPVLVAHRSERPETGASHAPDASGAPDAQDAPGACDGVEPVRVVHPNRQEESVRTPPLSPPVGGKRRALRAKLGQFWTLPEEWRAEAQAFRERQGLPAVDWRIVAEAFKVHHLAKRGRSTPEEWRNLWIGWAQNARPKPSRQLHYMLPIAGSAEGGQAAIDQPVPEPYAGIFDPVTYRSFIDPLGISVEGRVATAIAPTAFIRTKAQQLQADLCRALKVDSIEFPPVPAKRGTG